MVSRQIMVDAKDDDDDGNLDDENGDRYESL